MTDAPWHETVSLPALLRHARRTYGEAMRAALARDGFDDIPANGLYIIGGLALGQTGVPIGQLVQDLGITKQGAGQLVDTLVARGYVQRTPDTQDRRKLIVTLTDRGRDAAETQTAARKIVDAALLARIGEGDMAITRRALANLIGLREQSTEEPNIMSEATRFDNRAMPDTKFTNCAMPQALFENVNLADARYTDVNLRGARFSNVNMAGVRIEDANIDGLMVAGHDVQALIRGRQAGDAPAGRARGNSARPFLPAKDFLVSKAFYKAIGFEMLLDSDVAIFSAGSSAFILQRYYVKEWAENCMMQLMVDDLDGWWARLDALDLPGLFAIPVPKPPAMQPWGLRVGFLVDPSGVLWHIAERRADVPAD
jgi:DNA-binding MarR family transcriptional regulator